MSVERFMKLAEDNQGFELIHAYRDDVDHDMGCKDNSCWYIIKKNGKDVESYTGTLQDGV